jgi:hypothetical protein
MEEAFGAQWYRLGRAGEAGRITEAANPVSRPATGAIGHAGCGAGRDPGKPLSR